jgi:hypothetical protein
MAKVLLWLCKQQLSLRFRRMIFCLSPDVDQIRTLPIHMDHFPGSVDDRIQMLLYRVPEEFTCDAARLRPIAYAMIDYAVFQPRIWKFVTTTPEATIDEFFSSFLFQVHRRMSVVVDMTALDNFPSFEASWRRSFSGDLYGALVPTPDATCTGLHRVVPAGVSRSDAVKCIQTALPSDLRNPYALTVASEAVDDRCGTIVITQRTQQLVVNIQCTMDPTILSRVCRELRTGHRLIAQEMIETKSVMTANMSELKCEIAQLKELIVSGVVATGSSGNSDRCSKRTCHNVVSDRFGNGQRKKQCTACLGSKKGKRLKME